MDNDNYFTERLDKDAFEVALQKGLGRAFLQVKKYGINDVVDLIIKACVHDLAHDPQSESSKAKWLYNMFKDTPYYPEISNVIFHSLLTEKDTWDVQQLFELAKEMAVHGDTHAIPVIEKRAFEKASCPSEDDWLGAAEWIEINGIEGAIKLAIIYGQRLLANPKDWIPDDINWPEGTTRKIQIILSQSSEQEPALKAYWKYLDENGYLDTTSSKANLEAKRQHLNQEQHSQFSLGRVLTDAENKIGNYPGYYSTFGKQVNARELEVIYSRLLNEKDDAVRLRLLWVFGRTPVPWLDEIILKWANGKDNRLKSAAIIALEQISDMRVHELARQKVREGKFVRADDGILDLFINNYNNDDARLITEALTHFKPNDKDEAHSLASSIEHIARKQHDVRLKNVLQWAYENTPCSNCRHRIIVDLNAIQQFDGVLLYECQSDSDEETRKLAREKITNVASDIIELT